MALAQAVRTAMNYGYEYKDLTNKINQINWDPEYYVWTNILVTSSSNKKMITGSQTLKDAGNLIAYMLVGKRFTKDEKNKLLETLRKAQNDEKESICLPQITEQDVFMGKLIDIKNGEQEKAFELHSCNNALYLSVKCSDNRKGNR